MIQSGYKELSDRLHELVATFRREECNASLVVPSQDFPTAVPIPMTEKDSILSLLFSLRGSKPSIRRRHVSFQSETLQLHALDPLSPLANALFSEVPNPYSLTNTSQTEVNLQKECGGAPPSDVFAGCEAVLSGFSCLQARPNWEPNRAGGLPKYHGWLPIPELLLQTPHRVEVQQAKLMHVPLAVLGMDEDPGSYIFFDGLQNRFSETDGHHDSEAVTAKVPMPYLEEKESMKGSLWGLEEAEVGKDAVLALQGVQTSIERLKSMVEGSAGMLQTPSLTGVLKPILVASHNRLRLEKFVSAFTTTGSEFVMCALAHAVDFILRRHAAALQQLESDEATTWTTHVTVGSVIEGRNSHGQGMTPLQVGLHTRGFQRHLDLLAHLLWCQAPQQGDPEMRCCLWEVDKPPQGSALLTYLYNKILEAEEEDHLLLRFLFAEAMQPYLRHLNTWVFGIDPPVEEFSARLHNSMDRSTMIMFDTSNAPSIPVQPPVFLLPIHDQFLRAGAQLRLLQSLPDGGAELVEQLRDVCSKEASTLEKVAGIDAGGPLFLSPIKLDALLNKTGNNAGDLLERSLPTTCCLSPLKAENPFGRDAERAVCTKRDPAFSVTCRGLFQAVLACKDADFERMHAVHMWLDGLSQQRLDRESADVKESLERVNAMKQHQIQITERRQAALENQKSAKREALQSLMSDNSSIIKSSTGSDSGYSSQLLVVQEGENDGEEVTSKSVSASPVKPLPILTMHKNNSEMYNKPLDKWKPPRSMMPLSTIGPSSSHGDDGDELTNTPAPLQSALETCIVQRVLSQYRAVSKASVGYFLDQCRLLDYFEFFRKVFYMEAGDFGDKVSEVLSSHVDDLRTFTDDGVQCTLEQAIRGTSLEKHRLIRLLRCRLRPGLPPVEAEKTGLAMKSLAASSRVPSTASRSYTAPPGRVEALDALSLECDLEWPLQAVFPPDILQSYSSVFSVLLRLRRIDSKLKGLHRSLSALDRTIDACMAAKLKRVRGFLYGAMSFLTSVQSTMQSFLMSDAWLTLVAKLMVSSEEVAATVVLQNSANLTSRMSSIGPAGKAAHQLACALSREISSVSAHTATTTTWSRTPLQTARSLGLLTFFARSGEHVPNAQSWMQAVKASQQGIIDLQELLDLHRQHARTASHSVLTYNGHPEVAAAFDASLLTLLQFCTILGFNLVKEGGQCSGGVWEAVEHHMSLFERQTAEGYRLTQEAGRALARLSTQMNFNKWFDKETE